MPADEMNAMLDANRRWAQETELNDPGFFQRTSRGQRPNSLWIGCSDSRVPESVVTGANPGDIFVHRNVANQFHPTDDNARSALRFAVDNLRVRHVIVVGHSNCGGAQACLGAVRGASPNPVADPTLSPDDSLNRWLDPLIKRVQGLSISNVSDDEALQLIIEDNVRGQVETIVKTDVVKGAWASGRKLWVHGFVYDLATGLLKDLGVSQGPDIDGEMPTPFPQAPALVVSGETK